MPVQKKLHYERLKDKWSAKHQGLHQKLWEKHKESLNWFKDKTKHFAVGSAASLMLLTAPVTPLLPAHTSTNQEVNKPMDNKVFLIYDLSKLLPQEVIPLTEEQEKNITQVLSRDFGFNVVAELEGKRLERNYGLIGAEQHLARYPGDNMNTHFDNNEDANQYSSSGMAPGLGGWGYFMDKGELELSEKDKLREKYYIAVQTFIAPGFDKNPREIIDFFRFRKMLVINSQNGKAIIAVVGDAGPSVWTGKHLGGSPEVMHYLERVDGAQKGPVLYFFIDDPEDKVPLGPIDI